jgi:hypothetical protein
LRHSLSLFSTFPVIVLVSDIKLLLRHSRSRRQLVTFAPLTSVGFSM